MNNFFLLNHNAQRVNNTYNPRYIDIINEDEFGVKFGPVTSPLVVLRIHMHTDEALGIFSIGDVYGMAKFYQQKKAAQHGNLNLNTSIVVTTNGIYALRLKDETNLDRLIMEGNQLFTSGKYKGKTFAKVVHEQSGSRIEKLAKEICSCDNTSSVWASAQETAFMQVFTDQSYDSVFTVFKGSLNNNTNTITWSVLSN